MNKKWLYLIIPFGLLIVAGIIIKMKTIIPEVVDVPEIREGFYKGTYMSFEFPTKFKMEKVPTTDGRVLENWKLTEKADDPTVILVGLYASNKELGQFEPVQQRRLDKLQYIEEVGRKGEQRGVLFRTVDKKERTVYFSNNRRILMVDYIAKTTEVEKEVEYQTFLEGISWE